MVLSRRKFLIGSGTLAAATTLRPGNLLAALERQTLNPPALSPAKDWASIRSQFPLVRDYLHFASFFLVSHPRPVRAAIEDFRRALDANPFFVVVHGMFESEAENLQRKVCKEIAPYLDAEPTEIALTGNTTMGLALVYNGLPLKPGDEVLTTTHDHYSHHESIRLAVERVGAGMRKIPLFDRPEDASVSGIVERIRSAIRPSTRALGVTWVHSSSGVRLPIREIARALEEINRKREEAHAVLLVVDGVHGLGAVDESVARMGCDYFCAGTHKWIFAPRGTGIIWAVPKSWARLRPTIPTFSKVESFDAWMNEKRDAGPNDAARMTPGGFTAYEHQWAMGAAFRFHRQIGRPQVAERIRQLNDRCKSGLAAIPHLTLHTPRDPELSAGIIAFEVDRIAPKDVVKMLLERRIIASASPYKVSYARLAPSLVNTPEEVDAAVAAVRAIARR